MPTGMRGSHFPQRVQLLSGAEVKVSCKRGDTVFDLKRKVSIGVGKPSYALRLIDELGRELSNSDTLADANLRRGSIIKVVCDASKIPITFSLQFTSGHKCRKFTFVKSWPETSLAEFVKRLIFLQRVDQKYIHLHDADGHELRSDDTLADAGVTEGDVLHIVLDHAGNDQIPADFPSSDDGIPADFPSSDEGSEGPPGLVDSSDEEGRLAPEVQRRGLPRLHMVQWRR